jgi:hypothetical protein
MKNSVQLQSKYRCRMFVAICLAALLATIPPNPVRATEIPLAIDTAFSVGPIALQLNITNPVAQPGGFRSTLHIHVRDDAQTPVSTVTWSPSEAQQMPIRCWAVCFPPPPS